MESFWVDGKAVIVGQHWQQTQWLVGNESKQNMAQK